MKKILFVMMLISTCPVLLAQQTVQLANNPYPKTITVNGSAEMEIVPDEIYVNITLREYQKRGESKKEIETIKTNFLESCRGAGIPDSTISIFSFTGFNNYYSFKKRKKDPDMMSSITYQVKFKDSKTMDALVEKLDDEATQNFTIANTSHSKMTEFRKQLKTNAIQAAKDKGIYLTEAINEKLGEAITIEEPKEPGTYSYGANSQARAVSNYSGNAVMRSMSIPETEIDFKKIKLRFEVEIVFALK